MKTSLSHRSFGTAPAERVDERGSRARVELLQPQPLVPGSQNNFLDEAGMSHDDEAVSVASKQPGPVLQCLTHGWLRLVIV